MRNPEGGILSGIDSIRVRDYDRIFIVEITDRRKGIGK